MVIIAAGLAACTTQSPGHQAAAKPSSQEPASRTATASPAAPASSSPAAEPTFAYPGDPQCAITYRDNHDGTMSWTAKVTVAGQLITHVSDKRGNIYRHVVQVIPGLRVFSAPVPLSQINDAGGVVYGKNGSQACSIAPQH